MEKDWLGLRVKSATHQKVKVLAAMLGTGINELVDSWATAELNKMQSPVVSVSPDAKSRAVAEATRQTGE